MKNFIITLVTFFVTFTMSAFANTDSAHAQLNRIIVETPCKIVVSQCDTTMYKLNKIAVNDLNVQIIDGIMYIKNKNGYYDNNLDNLYQSDNLPLIRIFNPINIDVVTTSSLHVIEHNITAKPMLNSCNETTNN